MEAKGGADRMMEDIREWVACHKQAAIGFAALLVVMTTGFFWFFWTGAGMDGDALEAGTDGLVLDETYLASAPVESSAPPQSEETDLTEEIIIIDIKGAVNKPGVYRAEPDMRVMDIIDLAGGLGESADPDKVNLAQRVTDQMVIYIPAIGEETTAPLPAPENSSNEAVSESQASGEGEKVDINTADAALLQTLTGIGEKKAALIIAYREENGSFQTIEEIMGVSGIGEKTFEGFKDTITVGAK